MEIIITESQLPRIVAMNWLIKFTRDFRKKETDKSVKIISNNDEIVFEYDKLLNVLTIDYGLIWSFIYHQLRFDKDTSKLIIRAFAIDYLGFSNLKLGGRFKVEDLNDYSKSYKLNEDEKILSEPSKTEPLKSTLNPVETKPLDMNLFLNKNPFITKFIPNKDSFLKSVHNLSSEEKLNRLVKNLNTTNPNLNAKISAPNILNFNIKNPFVNQSQQIKNPIKIKGNANLRLLPTPKLNNLMVNVTIPF